MGPKLGFKCNHDNCEFISLRAQTFWEHLKVHKSDGQVVSDSQPDMISDESSRQTQNGFHHRIKSVFKCQMEGCAYQTFIIDNMIKHRLTHRKDRPFRCTEKGCGKSYKSKEDMEMHATVGHRKVKPRAWPPPAIRAQPRIVQTLPPQTSSVQTVSIEPLPIKTTPHKIYAVKSKRGRRKTQSTQTLSIKTISTQTLPPQPTRPPIVHILPYHPSPVPCPTAAYDSTPTGISAQVCQPVEDVIELMDLELRLRQICGSPTDIRPNSCNEIVIQTSNDKLLEECPQCSYRGKTKFAVLIHRLKSHRTRHHFRCNHLDCEKRFKTRSSLAFHQNWSHSVLITYCCDWPGCHLAFKRRTVLQLHIRTIHGTYHIRYECDYCDTSYKYKTQLNQHMKTVHSIDDQILMIF